MVYELNSSKEEVCITCSESWYPQRNIQPQTLKTNYINPDYLLQISFHIYKKCIMIFKSLRSLEEKLLFLHFFLHFK